MDSRDFVAGGGPMSLQLGATNAAGVQGLVSETLVVDSEPVSVALSMPNDSNPRCGRGRSRYSRVLVACSGRRSAAKIAAVAATTPTPIRTEAHQGRPPSSHLDDAAALC